MIVDSCTSKMLTFTVVVITVAVTLIAEVCAQSSCTTLQLQSGVCVPILTCNLMVQLLNRSPRPLPNSIRDILLRSHCGTFENNPYVCCEPNDVIEVSTTPSSPTSTTSTLITTTGRTDVRIGLATPDIHASVEKSEADEQSGLAILEATSCGKNDGDRVANGIDAFLSEYPWMTLLVYEDDLGSRTMNCGGSLITDRYVLTAAHCIYGISKKLVSVRLGEHDTDKTTDCEFIGKHEICAPPLQEIDIEEAIYHKDYSRVKFINDIGLIRLISQATFQRNIQAICLPITSSSQSANHSHMIIAGWGRMENGLKANKLQKAVVPIRTNLFCQEYLRAVRMTEKHMCAGGQDEIDTCKGDSGGPLFGGARYRKSARYIQYGIVSAGTIQCGSNFPGIYVRVMSYLPWIASNMRS